MHLKQLPYHFLVCEDAVSLCMGSNSVALCFTSDSPAAREEVRTFMACAGQSAGMGNPGLPLHLLQQQEQLLRYCP